MTLQHGLNSTGSNLNRIYESDDDEQSDDCELQNPAIQQPQSRPPQPHSPRPQTVHRLSSGASVRRGRRQSSASIRSRRRLSTGVASINDALSQTKLQGDKSPVCYRDYLRAERNLKAASFRSPLSFDEYDDQVTDGHHHHHHHHHQHHQHHHHQVGVNDVPSSIQQQHHQHNHTHPSAISVPHGTDPLAFSHSDRRDGLNDSDYHDPINTSINSSGRDLADEAKRRRREKKREEAYRKNVHNLAAVGRRGSMMTGDHLLWEALMDTEEDMEYEEELLRSGPLMIGEEQVTDDQNGQYKSQRNSGIIPWYSPPMQRVFYGKPQVLPHVNWGDLFLDLFFVAAAYNLGALLISSMNESDWLRGLVYFVGIFGALYRTWYNDLTFSSRYTVVDQFHRLIWGFKFFVIGVAIIFITPLNLMGDRQRNDTPGFILALLVESLITFGLNLETYFKAQGDRTPIKKHAKRMILNEDLPTMFFYIAAFTLATLGYYNVDIYGNHSSDGDHRMLAGESNIGCSSGGRLLLSRMLGATEVDCPSDVHRKLAAATAGDGCTCHTGINFSTDDVPMAIVLFAYWFYNVFSFSYQLKLASKEKDIRDRFVPNNLDYVVHRYGEWTMLMIGEGVLSLLIVETTDSIEYFIVSCFGVLTVMGIHLLVFESQPSTSDGHAIYRSLRAQLIFGLLVQSLSLGLIAFGVSFKIMLNTIVSDNAKYDSYESRRLAATPSVSEEATSSLFSGSLAIVLITLELMLANHKGPKGTYKRLFKSRDGGVHGIIKKVNKPLILLSLFKLGLILFTATLSQWEKPLTEVSIIAFAIVLSMSISRVIGWGMVHKEDEIRRMLKSLQRAPGSLHISFRQVKSRMSDELLNLLGVKSGSDCSSETPPEGVDELVERKELWDTSLESIFAFDRNGRLEYINSTALNLFGYSSSSEIQGFDVSILFRGTEDEGDPLGLKNLDPSDLPQKVLGRQVGKERTLYAKREDGSEFPCVIGMRPVAGTDFISGFIQNPSNHRGFEKVSMETFVAAAARGDENEIKRMLPDASIQINAPDYDLRTALHLASDNGHAKVVQVLCEARADVNVEDRFGNYPLDCAVEGGHTDCVRILARFGAKRGKCGQLSQLMDATMRGDSYEVKVLIDKGDVDINESCSSGRTALHVAVAQGLESIVQLLCEEGANVNAEDQELKRPMDLVDEKKHPSLRAILQKHGATTTTQPKVATQTETTSGDDIFEDAFDAIIICDIDGFIQKVNSTALRLLDYTSKESLVDRRISYVCPDLDSCSNNPAITKARRKDFSELLCMVASKKNEHTKLVTFWIRDISAFDRTGLGLGAMANVTEKGYAA